MATSRPTPANQISVPLLDIVQENAAIESELIEALTQVVQSGRFLYGPAVTELEQQVAELTQAQSAIGCASGSDALLLALMACEVGPGDEVILPSFTFFATASCVVRLGATPVFVDICHSTFNIDPDAIAAAITPRTKAIIPVHLFGQCAEMKPITELAEKHNLYVIEDAAQAIGASYQGQPAGSMGDIGCISFYPTKNLGGMGDGGMLTTQCAQWEAKLRLYSAHGMQPRYYHQVVGINSRLDTLQAAALVIKLRQLASWNAARQSNADRYQQQLSELQLEWLELPQVPAGHDPVWNQYTVRVTGGGRDALKAFLADRQIGSEIYYPIPVHQQACFAESTMVVHDMTETERAAAEVLSLPVSPQLTVAQQDAVIGALQEFDRQRVRTAA